MEHIAEVYQLARPTTAASPAAAAPRAAVLGGGPGLGRTEPHGSLAGCSTAQKIAAKGMEALDAPRRKTPGWDRVTESSCQPATSSSSGAAVALATATTTNPAMHKSLQELGKEEVNNIKWQDAGLKVRRIYEKALGW